MTSKLQCWVSRCVVLVLGTAQYIERGWLDHHIALPTVRANLLYNDCCALLDF
jgi:hypothetical protein